MNIDWLTLAFIAVVVLETHIAYQVYLRRVKKRLLSLNHAKNNDKVKGINNTCENVGSPSRPMNQIGSDSGNAKTPEKT